MTNEIKQQRPELRRGQINFAKTATEHPTLSYISSPDLSVLETRGTEETMLIILELCLVPLIRHISEAGDVAAPLANILLMFPTCSWCLASGIF